MVSNQYDTRPITPSSYLMVMRTQCATSIFHPEKDFNKLDTSNASEKIPSYFSVAGSHGYMAFVFHWKRQIAVSHSLAVNLHHNGPSLHSKLKETALFP